MCDRHRMWALVALLVLPPCATFGDDTAPSEVRRCLKDLRSADGFRRHQAVECLGPLAKDSPEARRALIGALKDRRADPYVRDTAAFHLGEVGASTKDIVPALVAVLDDKDGRVVGSAVGALARIGPDAIPELAVALARNTPAAMAAADALGAIGHAALPTLIEALKDPKLKGRAAHGLQVMKPPPPASAVPALVDALRDPYAGARLGVLLAIRAAGTDAVGAVPALIACLDDSEQFVRVGAMTALSAIGPNAAAAVPKLWDMSRNPKLDQQTRLNAELALKKIQGR